MNIAYRATPAVDRRILANSLFESTAGDTQVDLEQSWLDVSRCTTHATLPSLLQLLAVLPLPSHALW